ncbi:MAG: hypothetical protein ACKV2T_25745 [Kofleriaceae bacterium]
MEAVELMSSLVAHARAVIATLSERQLLLSETRNAERLGISVDAWRALRAAPLSVEWLREAHVAVTGRTANVRRANEDGSWGMVAPKPGRLRSRPQAFRIGNHVERAWDHNTLRKHLAELMRSTVNTVDRAPFETSGRMVWNLMRAQPFLGLNERMALLVAARLLHGVGIPGLPIVLLEYDDELTAAAIATDFQPLAAMLERAAWRDALEFAEWLPVAPDASRWSFEDEQRVAAAARERAPSFVGVIAETSDRLAERVRGELGKHLGRPIGGCVVSTCESLADRVSVAIASARCGRVICPQLPVATLRWSTSSSLVARAVIGAVGRGLTGAMAVHFTFEVGGAVGRNPPTILLVPTESLAERASKIDQWISRAVAQAIERAPLRC